jgi:hypothetical protein
MPDPLLTGTIPSSTLIIRFTWDTSRDSERRSVSAPVQNFGQIHGADERNRVLALDGDPDQSQGVLPPPRLSSSQ